MLAYVLRRLLQAIPVLLGVTLITFLLVQIVAGDPARLAMGVRGDAGTIESIREQMGLNDPLLVQYGRYLGKILCGDFGRSLANNEDVFQAIISRFPATAKLGIMALMVSILIGIPLGIISAVWRDSFLDNFLRIISLLGISTPSFFLALLLAWIVGYELGWTPISGYELGWVGWSYYILPTIALAFGPIAVFSRLVRSSMLQVLREDYVLAAKARGLSGTRVVLKHVLKNSLIPVITTIGSALAGLLSGAFFIEYVFNWPGIGLLAVDAISNYDIVMIQGTVMFTAVIFVLANIVVDIAYRMVDPRVRLQ